MPMLHLSCYHSTITVSSTSINRRQSVPDLRCMIPRTHTRDMGMGCHMGSLKRIQDVVRTLRGATNCVLARLRKLLSAVTASIGGFLNVQPSCAAQCSAARPVARHHKSWSRNFVIKPQETEFRSCPGDR